MPLHALFLILLGLAMSLAFLTGLVPGLVGAGLNAGGALVLLLGMILWRVAVLRRRSRG